jgi:hypothetical protein
MKFKVGDTVKVFRKIESWGDGEKLGAIWINVEMDKTIGKKFKIIKFNKNLGYLLDTHYWYPEEALLNFRNEKLSRIL